MFFLNFSYLFWHILSNKDIKEKEEYFLKCLDLHVTGDRIVSNLKTHGRRLQAKMKQQKGGKCRKQIIDQWKSGNLSYELKVFNSELESSSMLTLIDKLKDENNQSKNLVEMERKSHIEKESNSKVSYYQEKLRNLCCDDGKRGPTKSKYYGDLSRSQQFRVRKSIEKKCKANVLFMEHFNFKATNI